MSGITAEYIQNLWPITYTDTVNDRIKVAGDRVDLISAVMEVVIVGSTGNDGTYTVTSLYYYPPTQDETQIRVSGDIADDTVDGSVRWDNQFSVAGDRTSEFSQYRRIRANCGADGYGYSYVLAANYDAGTNKTTVELGEPVLTANLIEVHYGLISIGGSGAFPVQGMQGNMPRDLAVLDHGSHYDRGEKALNLQTGRSYNGRVACGEYAVGIGYNTEADGKCSVHIGSVAPGDDAWTGKYAVGIGRNADAFDYCVAMGKDAFAYDNSVGIGRDTYSNKGSVSIGPSAYSGDYSVAMGFQAKVGWDRGVAIGFKMEQTGYGVCIGGLAAYSKSDSTSPPGQSSVTIGYKTYTGFEGVSIGYNSASHAAGVSIGKKAEAKGFESVSVGSDSLAYDWSVACGKGAYAYDFGVSFGYQAHASEGGTCLGAESYAAYYGVALGNGAKCQVDYTAVIAGGICTRKTANAVGWDLIRDYSAAEITIMSGVVDLTATGDTEISLPAGARFYANEVGVIAVRAAVAQSIVAVDTANDWVAVSGDETGNIVDGSGVDIFGSTGNDGTYTVASTVYDAGADQTEIHVSETISDSTVDGSVRIYGLADAQPSISFGEGAAGPATLSAAAATGGITETGARERRDALDKDAGVTVLSGTVSAAASTDTLQGRFYFQGLLVEDE